ncbi:MAG: DUF2207 domain-containing protein [Patescibacteria group bacterium]|nr:DUF2207 domain-containing protein [Patescibacteria group bacterium]
MKRFWFLLFALLFLLFPSKSFAEVIRGFDTQITAHKNGTMDITETIVYDFENENKHGIFRDIPLVTKVGDLNRVTKINFINILRDGNKEEYKDQSDSTKASVKIGKSNTLITGQHTYTISYSVENGIGSNFEDHDEIYWNVTGNSWKIPIEEASSKLMTDFGIVPDKATCFTGNFGSTEKNCDSSQTSFIKTTGQLLAYEGLSAVWSFPKNKFPPSVLQREAPSSSSSSVPFMLIALLFLGIPVLLNLIIAPVLFIWYWTKKRKKSLGAPPVNFDVPKDNLGKRIAPAEAGSIDTFQVDRDDIVATIFDLAIRKYIKIEEIKKEKTLGIFGTSTDYAIIKLKEYDGTEEFERTLFNKLFSEGSSIELLSLQKEFYETFNQIEENIFASHKRRGFYVKNPKLQMQLLLTFGILLIAFGGPMLGAVMIYLSRKLNGRTKLGDEMDFKIDGLKIFLKNMKRNYKWQAEKLYLVEEFIPYAIAFGIIDEFMKQLKEIYPKYNPTWYHGNLAFYAASSSMFGSMSSSFTTSAPSSSSGFSGGGFSGGGGGGGGGGSW